MRKYIFIALALSVSVLSLNSCDTFRRMAGRPTSDEIELKRQELEKNKASKDDQRIRQKRVADSLAAVAAADSIARVNAGNKASCCQDKAQQDKQDAKVTVNTTSKMGGADLSKGGRYASSLNYRYYVIMGCFRNRSNADRMFRLVASEGYSPVLIRFKNGYTAVGVYPTNDFNAALASRKKMLREEFCPSDVWILDNK